jgi:hypothetical protein
VDRKDCSKDIDLYKNLFGAGHLIFVWVFLFGVCVKCRDRETQAGGVRGQGSEEGNWT